MLTSEWFPESSTGGLTAVAGQTKTEDIQSQAVTATYAATDAGPDTFLSGIGSTPYLVISGPAVPDGSVFRVKATTTFLNSVTSPAGTQINLSGTSSIGTLTSTSTTYIGIEQKNITVLWEPLPILVSADWTVSMNVSPIGTDATFVNSTMQIEVIKK